MKERKRKDKQKEESGRPDKQSGVIAQVLTWLVGAGGMLALLLYADLHRLAYEREEQRCDSVHEVGGGQTQAGAMAGQASGIKASVPPKRSRSNAKNTKESSHTPANGIGQLSTPTSSVRPMVRATEAGFGAFRVLLHIWLLWGCAAWPKALPYRRRELRSTCDSLYSVFES